MAQRFPKRTAKPTKPPTGIIKSLTQVSTGTSVVRCGCFFLWHQRQEKRWLSLSIYTVPRELVRNPDLNEVKEILEEYIRRDFTIQVVATCRVSYSGRAQSKLDRGDRLIIKKQGSAFLVHGPENYQPRNWQPEVDEWSISMEEGCLVCTSKRNKPEEEVKVSFEEVDMISVSKLVDGSDLKISGHEVDIHDAVEDQPSIVEDGLRFVARERKTPAGYIDILGEDSDSSFVVVEIKRNPDYNTVLQLNRYVKEIRKEFSKKVRGVLLAPKASEEVIDYLEERDLEFKQVDMEDVISDYELTSDQSALEQF